MINPTFLQQYYAITFDPIQETLDFKSRVETDGGTVTDLKLIDAFIKASKDKGLYATDLRYAYAGRAGFKGSPVSKVYDLSPNDADRTNFNTVNSGFSLDGNKDFDFSSGGDIHLDEIIITAWTVMAFLKTTSADKQGFFGQRYARRSFEFRPSSNLIAYRDDGAGYNASGAGVDLDDGDWHCLGVTGNGAGNTVEYFCDGVDRGSDTTSGAELETEFIGYSSHAQNDGQIGLIAVWNKVLTFSEWDYIYDAVNKRI